MLGPGTEWEQLVLLRERFVRETSRGRVTNAARDLGSSRKYKSSSFGDEEARRKKALSFPLMYRTLKVDV